MWVADEWKDYECIDTADGEKLERWGEVILCRPDPQVIWDVKAAPEMWREANAHYHRSSSGGGKWEYKKGLPEQWSINYKNLTFNIKPMGFKHTGVFPEQADQAQRQGEDGPDLTLDDTALAYRGREGVYVITGCSHSGISNIVEQAKRVTGQDRVMGVIGGFHLRQMDARSQAIIDYLAREDIPYLYPCHCTALAVKVAMGNRMHIEEVGAGTSLEWV